MLPKERVRAVLDGCVPDKVPVHHISVSSRVASRILGHEAYVGGAINQWREATAWWNGPEAHGEFVERTRQDAIDIAIALDQDIVRPSYWRDPDQPTARLDEYTFRYECPDGDDWHIKHLDPATELYNVIEQSDRPQLQLDDLDKVVEDMEAEAAEYTPTEQDFADVAYVLERVGEQREVRAPGVSLCIPYDETAWLEAAALRPDLLARLLDVQVGQAVDNIEVLVRMGATVLFGGGDFASDLGPMYSPRIFHELMLPRLQKISQACHRLGLYHLFGTDGNVWAVADDLYADSGVDGHYEVDRKAGMDILSIHQRYPHITMIGNISSFTLHTGSPDDVAAETRACLEEAKQSNKVIAGCSNIIVSQTPDRNVDAMLEAIAKYR